MNLTTRQPAYSWSPVHRTQKQPGDYEYIYDRATGEHVARKVASQPMRPRFTEHGVKQ